MRDQQQYETRRNHLLGKAFVLMSVGLLFLTISLPPSLLYQVIGSLFIIFSLVFLLAALGMVIPVFARVLGFAEWVDNKLWLTFIITSFVLILVAWVDGIQKIDKSSWLVEPYFWIGPVWLLIFTGVFITLGLHQIVDKFRQDGKQVGTQNILVNISWVCGIIAIPLILIPILDIKYVVLILAIGLVALSTRFLIQR